MSNLPNQMLSLSTPPANMLSSAYSSLDNALGGKLSAVRDFLGLGSASSHYRYVIYNKEWTRVPEFAIESVEVNRDRTATTHPIETGVNISDHVFRNPATATVKGMITRENRVNSVARDTLFIEEAGPYAIYVNGAAMFNMALTSYEWEANQEHFDSMGITVKFTELIRPPVEVGLISNSKIPEYQKTIASGEKSPKTMTRDAAINARMKSGNSSRPQ